MGKLFKNWITWCVAGIMLLSAAAIPIVIALTRPSEAAEDKTIVRKGVYNYSGITVNGNSANNMQGIVNALRPQLAPLLNQLGEIDLIADLDLDLEDLVFGLVEYVLENKNKLNEMTSNDRAVHLVGFLLDGIFDELVGGLLGDLDLPFDLEGLDLQAMVLALLADVLENQADLAQLDQAQLFAALVRMVFETFPENFELIAGVNLMDLVGPLSEVLELIIADMPTLRTLGREDQLLRLTTILVNYLVGIVDLDLPEGIDPAAFLSDILSVTINNLDHLVPLEDGNLQLRSLLALYFNHFTGGAPVLDGLNISNEAFANILVSHMDYLVTLEPGEQLRYIAFRLAEGDFIGGYLANQIDQLMGNLLGDVLGGLLGDLDLPFSLDFIGDLIDGKLIVDMMVIGLDAIPVIFDNIDILLSQAEEGDGNAILRTLVSAYVEHYVGENPVVPGINITNDAFVNIVIDHLDHLFSLELDQQLLYIAERLRDGDFFPGFMAEQMDGLIQLLMGEIDLGAFPLDINGEFVVSMMATLLEILPILIGSIDVLQEMNADEQFVHIFGIMVAQLLGEQTTMEFVLDETLGLKVELDLDLVLMALPTLLADPAMQEIYGEERFSAVLKALFTVLITNPSFYHMMASDAFIQLVMANLPDDDPLLNFASNLLPNQIAAGIRVGFNNAIYPSVFGSAYRERLDSWLASPDYTAWRTWALNNIPNGGNTVTSGTTQTRNMRALFNTWQGTASAADNEGMEFRMEPLINRVSAPIQASLFGVPTSSHQTAFKNRLLSNILYVPVGMSDGERHMVEHFNYYYSDLDEEGNSLENGFDKMWRKHAGAIVQHGELRIVIAQTMYAFDIFVDQNMGPIFDIIEQMMQAMLPEILEPLGMDMDGVYDMVDMLFDEVYPVIRDNISAVVDVVAIVPDFMSGMTQAWWEIQNALPEVIQAVPVLIQVMEIMGEAYIGLQNELPAVLGGLEVLLAELPGIISILDEISALLPEIIDMIPIVIDIIDTVMDVPDIFDMIMNDILGGLFFNVENPENLPNMPKNSYVIGGLDIASLDPSMAGLQLFLDIMLGGVYYELTGEGAIQEIELFFLDDQGGGSSLVETILAFTKSMSLPIDIDSFVDNGVVSAKILYERAINTISIVINISLDDLMADMVGDLPFDVGLDLELAINFTRKAA